MNEPTILDYVKSIFKSFDTFLDFVRALFQRKDTTQMEEFRAPSEVEAQSSPSESVVTDGAAAEVSPARGPSFFQRIPWLVLGVLLFALLGQLQFEPPQKAYTLGIFFYFIALTLAVLGYLRGQWNATPLPNAETRTDTFSIRSLPFVLSLLLSALTFYYMVDNRFTTFNVSLWILTLFFHVLAFWVYEPRSARTSSSIKPLDWISQDQWKITITRRGLLIVAIVAVTVFFGFYKLYDVPDNMTSDHAEKLLDVYDITQGQYSIFFPRNTGREPLQFYFVALISNWLGVSFLSLKTSTALMGMLSMIYIYLLGREFGGERVGLLALAFAGMACWVVLIDRIGLRFAYYPPFTAATLYYFIRGLRLQRRNEFILAGIALGIGLNGYTPMRIVPFAMIVFFIIYLLHQKDAQSRKQALVWFGLMAFTAWIFIIPLTRYAIQFPDQFGERAFSRLGTIEREFPGPVWQIFLQNVWNGLKVFNWYGGNIWTFTLPNRPALDMISAALFLIGVALVIIRYIRTRNWQYIILLLAVPLLQLPSTLALAFPEENPALNRMSAAFVPVFLLVGLGLDGIIQSLTQRPKNNNDNEGVAVAAPSRTRQVFASIVVIGLFGASLFNNYDLIFNQYPAEFKLSNWNTRDMGLLMKDFIDKGGSPDQAWVIPFPFWADTRLPLFWAGTIYRGESALAPDRLQETVAMPGAKLFMFNIEDTATLENLRSLYPDGVVTIYQAEEPSKNFYVFRVTTDQ